MKSPYRFLSVLLLLLIESSQSDHVTVIRCPKQLECLANIDGETLKVIREHMYNTTDPCANFWDYACGSWTERPYYNHVDTFGAMTNYYADQMRATLESLQSLEGFEEISSMLSQIEQYYQACRSAGAYYLDMSKYLRELPTERIFGERFQWQGLYVKDSPVWARFNWLQSLAHLRQYGFNGVFIHAAIGFASNDSLKQVLEVKIPRPQKTFQSKYKIREILEEFQLDRLEPAEDSWKLAQEVYAFDKEMVELYRCYEETANNVKIISLEQLKITEMYLPWQQYFDSMAEAHLEPQAVLIELSGKLEYFKDLHLHLKQKDNHTIAWYILLNFCKYLLDIRPLVTDRECLLHTNVMFPLGLNYIYDRFLYRNREKDEIVLHNIFLKLKKHFSAHLQDNKFDLQDEELQYLQQKLSAVQLQIGNLPHRLPTDLNVYYASVSLSNDNFFRNHLEMLKFRFHLQHNVMWSPNVSLSPIEDYYVNDDISSLRNAPYFVHPRNLLIVPMVFVQLPFYHHSQHPVFQYSLVGWIMAHELSHAFDQYGLRFDSRGNEHPLGIQISLKPSFVKAVACLSKNSTTISLNERMADVNGLQLVWKIYTDDFLNTTELSSDLSMEKIFFLNFAQFFCSSLPPVIAHDPDDVRTRETLANLREFAEVFQCGKGGGEHFSDNCNIWRK